MARRRRRPMTRRRLLLVHAHPDDETINNGATMARYVADGAHVTLVTCTRGEEGEVLVPDLAHLGARARGHARRAPRAASSPTRWPRSASPTTATSASRASSATAGWPTTRTGARSPARRSGRTRSGRPTCCVSADRLVAIIREVRPQVLVTYDENGGVRPPRPHPGAPGGDVRARAGRRPVVPARPRRAVGRPEGVLDRDAALEHGAVGRGGEGAGHRLLRGRVGRRHPVRRRRRAGHDRDRRPRVPRRRRWPRCARTRPRSPPTARSSRSPTTIGFEAFGVEHYRLVHGELGPLDPETGRETDLFAGSGRRPARPDEGQPAPGQAAGWSLLVLARRRRPPGCVGCVRARLRRRRCSASGCPSGSCSRSALAAAAYLLAGWLLRNRLAVLAPGGRLAGAGARAVGAAARGRSRGRGEPRRLRVPARRGGPDRPGGRACRTAARASATRPVRMSGSVRCRSSRASLSRSDALI